MYYCGECKAAVLVLKGLVVRECECVAPIIAEASATLVGKSAVGA